MSVLKHLKTLQHVSITIQIIIRELVGSLLKSYGPRIDPQWCHLGFFPWFLPT